MITTILVTGGAGYIGAHTCKELATRGYLPVVYDNLSTGHAEFVKWGPLVIGDISDSKKLTKTIREFQPSAVIHFAANAYVEKSFNDPLGYYINNVSGTISLLESMRTQGINRMVFSSTCATYGTANENALLTEDTPQLPTNPYGRSKLIIEQILADLSIHKNFRSVCLRYFNAAGADSDGEIGEWHEPESRLIPVAIESSLGGQPLQVFGIDFPTLDGTAVRDYVHVSDLARGHVLAIEHLLSGKGSECINLGTGHGTSVKVIISTLEALDIKVRYQYADRRFGDPAFLVAEVTKASRVLGWSPQYTNLQDLLKTAISWHKRKRPSS